MAKIVLSELPTGELWAPQGDLHTRIAPGVHRQITQIHPMPRGNREFELPQPHAVQQFLIRYLYLKVGRRG